MQKLRCMQNLYVACAVKFQNVEQRTPAVPDNLSSHSKIEQIAKSSNTFWAFSKMSSTSYSGEPGEAQKALAYTA